VSDFRGSRYVAPIAGLFLGFLGCSPDPEIESRTITVHTPTACAVPASGYALFYAFGDFTPTFDSRFLRDVGGTLGSLPKNTRQLVVDISSEDLVFRGLELVPTHGDIDILAWPERRTCTLSGDIGLSERLGHQLTVTGSQALVSGGTESGRTPQSYVIDLRTGRVGPIDPDFDMRKPRDRASAVAFPGGVLVSGGTGSGGSIHDTAERFVTGEVPQFDREIVLGSARADHASVLLTNGKVLLVGGTASPPASSQDKYGPPLDTLEVLDVATGTRHIAGLATLAVARRNPRALRLANGEILIVGGFDRSGAGVRTIEWLTRDATAAAQPRRDIDVGDHQAAVALPAGGALIVTTLPAPGFGVGVIVMTPQGELEAAPTVAPKTEISQIVLLEAAGGAPMLWAGDRWYRWSPWQGAFIPFLLTDIGPSASAAFATADPGLLLWTNQNRIVGLRIEERGPYSTEVQPLLRTDPGPLAPDHLVSSSAVSPVHFETETGLTLPVDSSVFVADTTYANFDVEILVQGGQAPLLVLRRSSGETIEVGDTLCPRSTGGKIKYARRGQQITVTDDATLSCSLPLSASERVSIGLKGAPSGLSVLRELTIGRP
jgi:hypothetical protein